MTAPSLLDELEEVVRLAEKATPGPWLYRSKSNSWHKPPQQGTVYSYGGHIVGMDSDDEADNGWDEAFLIAAVQFMTAHHAELADMAKRLEAAERDAFKWQLLCADCDDAGEGNRAAINVVNDACRLGSGALERHYGQAAREGLDAAIAATQMGEDSERCLAAANALLRDVSRYLEPWRYPEAIKKIERHLQGAGDEGGRPA